MQTLFFPKFFCIINHDNAIKDIQTLLKSPEKSIKEIVNELEFPSLSFFGRYVRKHLGVSPRQYRHNLKET